MKYEKILLIIFATVLFLNFNGLFAQPIPNYELTIQNPVLSGTTYQFDIYLKRLGTTNFRLGNSQLIMSMDTAEFSSPALTKLPSSEHIGAGYFFDQIIANGNEIFITIGGNGSYTLATDIATTGNGSRIATYQISGVNVPILSPSFAWINPPSIIRTGISQIDASNNYRDITDTSGASHLNGGGELARLSGYVFNDINGNGVWNKPVESGLNGWTINMTGPSGPLGAIAGSGTWPLGYFEFDNLTPGSYTLTEASQTGWYPTVSPPNSIVLVSSQFSQNNLFGNYNGPFPYRVAVSTISNDSGFNGRIVPTIFSVQNTGNLMDSILFHVHDNRGWIITPRDSGFVLVKNQLVNVKVWVTISGIDPVGAVDSIWLVGRSYSDSTTKDSSSAEVTVLSITGTDTLQIADGWNMVSVPFTVNNYSVTALFPAAISQAFAYVGGYVTSASLANGSGYWLKFNGAQNVPLSGDIRTQDTISVSQGWNMIGGLSSPISTSNLVSMPPGMTTSSFFGYSGTYYIADTIKPGLAYWVRVNQGGSIILSSESHSGISPNNRIKIVPTSELPPNPPGKSARATVPPKQFKLEQNYPNPFNPTTRIEFAIPIKAHVTLKVYNMLGQEVVTLVNEEQDAGYKSVIFYANFLPTGIYIYRLNSGNYVQTNKMELMK